MPVSDERTQKAVRQPAGVANRAGPLIPPRPRRWRRGTLVVAAVAAYAVSLRLAEVDLRALAEGLPIILVILALVTLVDQQSTRVRTRLG